MIASSVATLVKVAPTVAHAFKRYWEGQPNALEPALTENYREWVRELAAQLEYILRLAGDNLDEVRRLKERMEWVESDVKARRVIDNCAFEAMREPIPERRAMWAAAAAGLAASPLAIEDKARVERTLRMLDPIDVMDLHAIADVVGASDIEGRSHGSADRLRHSLWERSAKNPDALELSLCVRVTSAGYGGSVDLHVTRTGRYVLLVMQHWLQKRPYPWPVPGRYPPLSIEERTSAQRAIGEIHGFTEFLSRARTAERIGKQFITQGTGRLTPPDYGIDAAPRLQLNVFDPDERANVDPLVEATANATGLRVHHGGPLGGDTPAFVVHITGDAHVLRALAEADGNFSWM